MNCTEIFKTEEITRLTKCPGVSGENLERLLAKAKTAGRLSLEESASLLNAPAAESERISLAAGEIKEIFFGRRVVLFAPLYVSNKCVNNCLYCSFRRDHKDHPRTSLSTPQVISEAQLLANQGLRRILLVYGEDPQSGGPDKIIKDVEAIYDKTPINILHINAAPFSVEDFRRVHRSGVGVYQSFQETYHPETYARLHPSGPKHDYDFRLRSMDRAIEGGFEDIGMGVLFGLHDWKFETLALLSHIAYLEGKYGKGPHTISVPRLMPAKGSCLPKELSSPVCDSDFLRLIAVLRLANPYAGVVITTRETHELRRQLLSRGASQISAASRTNPGGYSNPDENSTQFHVDDRSGLPEVVSMVLESGCLPSFCSACYNVGRQGKKFQLQVLGGKMKSNCEYNAVFSFLEYIALYAPKEHAAFFMEKTEAYIQKYLPPEQASSAMKILRKIKTGHEGTRGNSGVSK